MSSTYNNVQDECPPYMEVCIILCSCWKRCWTMGIPWQQSPIYSRSSSNHQALLEMLSVQSLETHSMMEISLHMCTLLFSLSLSLSLSFSFSLLSSHSVSSTLPTCQLSNVPWRRAGVKYTNNEVQYTIIFDLLKFSKCLTLQCLCIMPATDLSGFD